MATLILRDTYSELMKEMESLDKQKRETSEKIREAASHGDLKENGCLLYTSPSPRDISGSRMPSSA